jgi:hypothetical protein
MNARRTSDVAALEVNPHSNAPNLDLDFLRLFAIEHQYGKKLPASAFLSPRFTTARSIVPHAGVNHQLYSI